MATHSQKSKTPATSTEKTTTNIPGAEKPATTKSSAPSLNAGEPPLDADTPPLDAYTDAPATPLDVYDEAPTGGRVPPQDLNAEKSLLGALLLSDASFPDVLELVRPADFYDQRHRQIYTAFVSLYDHHRPIDLLTVTSELKNNGTLKAVGDDAAVLRIPEGHVQLVSKDLLIEGIHFDMTYCPLKHLGYKAIAVNLSDIAAMNAKPLQVLVGIAVSNRYSLEAWRNSMPGCVFVATVTAWIWWAGIPLRALPVFASR